MIYNLARGVYYGRQEWVCGRWQTIAAVSPAGRLTGWPRQTPATPCGVTLDDGSSEDGLPRFGFHEVPCDQQNPLDVRFQELFERLQRPRASKLAALFKRADHQRPAVLSGSFSDDDIVVTEEQGFPAVSVAFRHLTIAIEAGNLSGTR